MAYFPFYIDIKDKKILVVGGGKVALRKVEKLLQFEPKITVVAPFICDEIRKLGVSIIERKFIDSDIDNIFCAISATDDEVVNGHIFKLCSEKNILVIQLMIRINADLFFQHWLIKMELRQE